MSNQLQDAPSEPVDDRPEISVVIPVYGSEQGLPELHRRLTAALDELVGERFEVVYVDDASPDGSWDEDLRRRTGCVLRLIRDEGGRRILLLQLMRNSGQQRAVLCGLAHARGRFIVTMDDDLQHRPEEIRVLYDEICSTGADIIMGSYARKNHGLILDTQTILPWRQAAQTDFRVGHLVLCARWGGRWWRGIGPPAIRGMGA